MWPQTEIMDFMPFLTKIDQSGALCLCFGVLYGPFLIFEWSWCHTYIKQCGKCKNIFQNKEILTYQTFLICTQSCDSLSLKISKCDLRRKSASQQKRACHKEPPLMEHEYYILIFFIAYICTPYLPLVVKQNTFKSYLIYGKLYTIV